MKRLKADLRDRISEKNSLNERINTAYDSIQKERANIAGIKDESARKLQELQKRVSSSADIDRINCDIDSLSESLNNASDDVDISNFYKRFKDVRATIKSLDNGIRNLRIVDSRISLVRSFVYGGVLMVAGIVGGYYAYPKMNAPPRIEQVEDAKTIVERQVEDIVKRTFDGMNDSILQNFSYLYEGVLAESVDDAGRPNFLSSNNIGVVVSNYSSDRTVTSAGSDVRNSRNRLLVLYGDRFLNMCNEEGWYSDVVIDENKKNSVVRSLNELHDLNATVSHSLNSSSYDGTKRSRLENLSANIRRALLENIIGAEISFLYLKSEDVSNDDLWKLAERELSPQVFSSAVETRKNWHNIFRLRVDRRREIDEKYASIESRTKDVHSSASGDTSKYRESVLSGLSEDLSILGDELSKKKSLLATSDDDVEIFNMKMSISDLEYAILVDGRARVRIEKFFSENPLNIVADTSNNNNQAQVNQPNVNAVNPISLVQNTTYNPPTGLGSSSQSNYNVRPPSFFSRVGSGIGGTFRGMGRGALWTVKGIGNGLYYTAKGVGDLAVASSEGFHKFGHFELDLGPRFMELYSSNDMGHTINNYDHWRFEDIGSGVHGYLRFSKIPKYKTWSDNKFFCVEPFIGYQHPGKSDAKHGTVLVSSKSHMIEPVTEFSIQPLSAGFFIGSINAKDYDTFFKFGLQYEARVGIISINDSSGTEKLYGKDIIHSLSLEAGTIQGFFVKAGAVYSDFEFKPRNGETSIPSKGDNKYFKGIEFELGYRLIF